MRSIELDLVATAFRNVQSELGRMPVDSVKDSASIYLAKLRNHLADLCEASNTQFDRAGFERACQAS